MPGYIRSHVHWSQLDRATGEFVLLPDLPAADADPHPLGQREVALRDLAHATRSGSTRRTPRGSASGPATCSRSPREIGHFVDKVWVTEAIRPGVVGLLAPPGPLAPGTRTRAASRWSTALGRPRAGPRPGQWRMRQLHGIRPFESDDPDSQRIWWERRRRAPEPDVPGAARPGQRPCTAGTRRCASSRPRPDDRYGDVVVDTNKSHEVYRRWLAMARPAPGPGGLRRPLWLPRAYKPDPSSYQMGVRPSTFPTFHPPVGPKVRAPEARRVNVWKLKSKSKPDPVKTLQVETVAQAYLELLRDRGVDCFFANAGTDFASHHRRLRALAAEGKATPRPIVVPARVRRRLDGPRLLRWSPGGRRS